MLLIVHSAHAERSSIQTTERGFGLETWSWHDLTVLERFSLRTSEPAIGTSGSGCTAFGTLVGIRGRQTFSAISRGSISSTQWFCCNKISRVETLFKEGQLYSCRFLTFKGELKSNNYIICTSINDIIDNKNTLGQASQRVITVPS